ncbi:CopD family protein [Fibrivirga algicola]|uniref:Protoporphyrinogen IX oxidase n=1 Tax=Fibrivirga algicola TaxID=2950420 RepID=A0ABX0QI97_9BACT|nr:CopD family protein [Fibrivirga algicola]ARK09756.1 protoporphyrinogen IX oxidase [Fibrella sp. ES10-3-2-2]NID10667.1 CopD family protein [Fibrivirga algicola]
MTFFYVKALHIIFIVTWFAGLFYLPRLCIYFTEAADQPDDARRVLQRQFALMQRRLWYGITWPSAILTLLLGLSTWYKYGATPAWLIYKLLLVAGLYSYHIACHLLFLQQQRGELRYTSTQLRIWNEVATLFLFGIVFLVVLKDALSMLWGLGGLLLFGTVLMIAIQAYKRLRER